MQAEIENISNLERKLSISLPKEEMEKKVLDSLNEIAKTAKISGFRPGKAPMNLVKKFYQDKVIDDVINRAITSSYNEFLQEKNIRLLATGSINVDPYKLGEPLHFTVIFEVYPEIKLADFSSIKVKKFKTEITEKDLEDAMLILQKQNATWSEQTRGSQAGDRLIVDYDLYCDGQLLEKHSAKDKSIELNDVDEKDVIFSKIVKSLYGAKVGDEVKIPVTYPDNFKFKDLASKNAEFDIRIKKVLEAKLPLLDEKFAKEKLGISEGGKEAIYAQIRETMQKESDKVIQRKLKDAIFEELLKHNPIDLPKSSVDEELNHLKKQQEDQQKYYGDMYEKASEEKLLAQAKNNIALSFLLGEIIRVFAIKLDQKRLENKLREVTAFYPDQEKMINLLSGNERQMKNLEFAVLADQALEIIQQKVNIMEQVVTYKDLWK